MTHVNCAVEGDLDEAIVRRLLGHTSHEVAAVYGLMGKDYLRDRIDNYVQAAHHGTWFVLVDLDNEAPCGGELVASWVQGAPDTIALRVAVREAEAWLLADRSGIARYLAVSRDLIPREPDALPDPKGTVVGVARRSRSRVVREGIPPRPGSGRAIGPLYVAQLSQFVREHWDIDAAARGSASLARCVEALARLE